MEYVTCMSLLCLDESGGKMNLSMASSTCYVANRNSATPKSPGTPGLSQSVKRENNYLDPHYPSSLVPSAGNGDGYSHINHLNQIAAMTQVTKNVFNWDTVMNFLVIIKLK